MTRKEEVSAVLGHRMNGDDILYRVRWSTNRCQWVSGSDIDKDGIQQTLVEYWKTSDCQFKDKECQTNACYAVDFDEIISLTAQECTNFVQFSPGSWEQVSETTVPTEIISINYEEGTALVKYTRDLHPADVPLETLRDIAPVLLAEFMLSQ